MWPSTICSKQKLQLRYGNHSLKQSNKSITKLSPNDPIAAPAETYGTISEIAKSTAMPEILSCLWTHPSDALNLPEY